MAGWMVLTLAHTQKNNHILLTITIALLLGNRDLFTEKGNKNLPKKEIKKLVKTNKQDEAKNPSDKNNGPWTIFFCGISMRTKRVIHVLEGRIALTLLAMCATVTLLWALVLGVFFWYSAATNRTLPLSLTVPEHTPNYVAVMQNIDSINTTTRISTINWKLAGYGIYSSSNYTSLPNIPLRLRVDNYTFVYTIENQTVMTGASVFQDWITTQWTGCFFVTSVLFNSHSISYCLSLARYPFDVFETSSIVSLTTLDGDPVPVAFMASHRTYEYVPLYAISRLNIAPMSEYIDNYTTINSDTNYNSLQIDLILSRDGSVKLYVIFSYICIWLLTLIVVFLAIAVLSFNAMLNDSLYFGVALIIFSVIKFRTSLPGAPAIGVPLADYLAFIFNMIILCVILAIFFIRVAIYSFPEIAKKRSISNSVSYEQRIEYLEHKLHLSKHHHARR